MIVWVMAIVAVSGRDTQMGETLYRCPIEVEIDDVLQPINSTDYWDCLLVNKGT